MIFAFLNTRGWNEGKWRSLCKEGEKYDVIGVGETGWIGSVKWQEGGWIGIGTGSQIGEKNGGGVGIIIEEKKERKVEMEKDRQK